MPLSAGDKLGPYVVAAQIGAGGMGEVYKARDTRLDRSVAIKVLPEHIAKREDLRKRFEREARAVASLNHPNICTLYDIGPGYMVMELIDGETLAARIERGALPLEQTLKFAIQIADALDRAHRAGVTHRDVKPQNIMLTRDGVKVLDFGLAKTAPRVPGPNDATLTKSLTNEGTIMGTPQYMAPEQFAWKEADARSDIWAFGAVLYEMVTGRKAFHGTNYESLVGAILATDPAPMAAQPFTPAWLERLVRRCLAKDPERRYQSMRDVVLDLETSAMETVVSPARRNVMRVAIAGLACAAFAALVTWALTRPSPRGPGLPALALGLSARFAIIPPPEQPLALSPGARDLVISPDGRYLVYRTGVPGSSDGPLVVRAIDRLEVQPLAGTDNASWPFFSPDSRWIGFVDGSDLKKVSITGGPTITICHSIDHLVSPSWGDNGAIIFSTYSNNAGLLSVSADGGRPTTLARPDAAKQENDFESASVLPGGRGVLFTIDASRLEGSRVAVLDLKTGLRKTLIRGGRSAVYAEPGHLLYEVAGRLLAVKFDLDRLTVLGDPVLLVDTLQVGRSAANFAVSRTGTLVYVAGQVGSRSLVWVDRKGRETPINAPPRAYMMPRVSPDGTRVALEIRDQENDIWIWDLKRESLRRLTFGRGVEEFPVWTPDSRRVIFRSNREGVFDLYGMAADGTGPIERLTTGLIHKFPNAVTPDGTRVLGAETTDNQHYDIVLYPAATPRNPKAPGTAPGVSLAPVERLVQTPFSEFAAVISPDGHYLAYQSDESGRFEVNVRPFPKVNEGRWQVSTGGGTSPAWAPNGMELFFLDGSNTLTAAPVETSNQTFSAGPPARIFDTKYAAPYSLFSYDVSPDGRRFLMIKEKNSNAQGAGTAGMVVVFNWFEETTARPPGGN